MATSSTSERPAYEPWQLWPSFVLDASSGGHTVLYASVNRLTDLEPAVLQQVEQFFTNYQRVRNIEFNIIEHGGSRAALAPLKG